MNTNIDGSPAGVVAKIGCVPNTVTRSLLITSDSPSLHLSQNLPIATLFSSSMNSELLKSLDLIYQPAVLRIQPIGANL